MKYLGIRIDSKFNWKLILTILHLSLLEPMQCFINLEILLMLEFWKQFIIPYLSHIFIVHVLYGDKMYAQSIVFSYFKRKHRDWFITISWTLHKICKHKGFLWATFSRIWTEFKDIYAKICFRENPYFPIFYPVWCIWLINPENYPSLTKNNRHYTENR